MKFTARELEQRFEATDTKNEIGMSRKRLPVTFHGKTMSNRTIVHFDGIGYWVTPHGVSVTCNVSTTSFVVSFNSHRDFVSIATKKINHDTLTRTIDKVLDVTYAKMNFISLYHLGKHREIVPSLGTNGVLVIQSPKPLRLIDPTIPERIARATTLNDSMKKDYAELSAIGAEWQEKMMGAIKTTKERAMVIHDTLPIDYTG